MHTCHNCAHTYAAGAGGSVSAKLCPRCHTYARRHGGVLPPVAPLRSQAGEGARLDIRCSTEFLASVHRAAERDGMPVAAWVRRALELVM